MKATKTENLKTLIVKIDNITYQKLLDIMAYDYMLFSKSDIIRLLIRDYKIKNKE